MSSLRRVTAHLVDALSQQRAPEMKVLTDDTNGLALTHVGRPSRLTQHLPAPSRHPPTLVSLRPTSSGALSSSSLLLLSRPRRMPRIPEQGKSIRSFACGRPQNRRRRHQPWVRPHNARLLYLALCPWTFPYVSCRAAIICPPATHAPCNAATIRFLYLHQSRKARLSSGIPIQTLPANSLFLVSFPRSSIRSPPPDRPPDLSPALSPVARPASAVRLTFFIFQCHLIYHPFLAQRAS